MGGEKKDLERSYYFVFCSLIVIPIMVIIIVSLGIISSTIRESALENIRRTQENVLVTLGSEVKDISLRLSHFVYVNNSEIMSHAAGTNTDDIQTRRQHANALAESFDYAVSPGQDILSAIFVMKDGDITYMKDNITLSMEELRGAPWYQEALSDKNTVKIGYYDTSVTSSRQNATTFTIMAMLSPGHEIDREGRIEMTALFVSSRINSMIRNYNSEATLGKMLLLNDKGQVIFDPSHSSENLPSMENFDVNGLKYETYGGKKYVNVMSTDSVTGCSVVNRVRVSELTRGFQRISIIIVCVTAVLLFLFYCFSSYFLKSIIKPIHHMVTAMEKVEQGNLTVQLTPSGHTELWNLVDSFNHMVQKLDSVIKENELQQQQKREAEIRALQSQISPHFLVNSLNSIRFMAQVAKFDGIRKMAEALIKILSTSFRSNSGFHTIREELDVLDGFIYLMKIRYSDGFDIQYQVQEECLEVKIPRLILQPIVENSIIHGFSEMIDDIGMIRLTIEKHQNEVCFEIEDNGKGTILPIPPRDETKSSGIGVQNVYHRLKLNYGDKCDFFMESEPGCTKTTIRIWFEETQEENA